MRLSEKHPFSMSLWWKSSKINCVQIWLLRHEEPTKLRWTQLHQWYTMGDTAGNVISCTGMVQLEWYISCVGEVGVQLKMRLIASKGLPLQINQGVNCDGPSALHCSSQYISTVSVVGNFHSGVKSQGQDDGWKIRSADDFLPPGNWSFIRGNKVWASLARASRATTQTTCISPFIPYLGRTGVRTW